MKNLLSLFILILTMSSCNESIGVSPFTKTSNSLRVPDYNFLATTAFDFVYPNTNQTYTLPIELYLRPFEGVQDTTSFVLEFGSTKYAQLLILKDTLLPGDKLKIRYSDFSKFRLLPTYQSVISGEHALTFSVTSATIKKASTVKIIAKN